MCKQTHFEDRCDQPGDNERYDNKLPLVLEDSHVWSRSKEHFCVANFFISKSWKGSSRHLKPFWARMSVYRAERAVWRFPESAGEGPSSANKVPSGTPLPDRRSGLILNDFAP